MSDRFFDRIAPSVLAALVLIGGYYGQPPLVALAMTLLFTVWLTRAWSGLSLRALRYERETSDERAFPGDELLLTLRLTNDKLLPLPWVEVDETLPRGLVLHQGSRDPNRHPESSTPVMLSVGEASPRPASAHETGDPSNDSLSLSRKDPPQDSLSLSQKGEAWTGQRACPRGEGSSPAPDALASPEGLPLRAPGGGRQAPPLRHRDAMDGEDGTGPETPPEGGRLRLACSLGWKERATWRYRLDCRRRGIYQLGPAVVTSGDPFGFFPRSSRGGETSRVVVYPKLIPLEQMGLPAGFPLGDSKPPLWIFEDPSRNVGVRDYRREDPFRRIHWKASARRQELQVKVHEPTTTLEVALFLAVDSFAVHVPSPDPQPPTVDHEAFERAVSVAASLAHLLLQRRHPVGLYVNGGAAESRDPLILLPAGSQEQLIRILEALAGVEPAPCLPMATLLAEVVPRLPWGSSVILVAGSLPDPLPASLQTLERMGRKPIVLAGQC